MSFDPVRVAALDASARVFAGLAANAKAAPSALSDTAIKELAVSLEGYLRTGRSA